MSYRKIKVILKQRNLQNKNFKFKFRILNLEVGKILRKHKVDIKKKAKKFFEILIKELQE